MYDISFIAPSIRVNLWKQLYESIVNSFSGSWEIIFVGPYDNLKSLQFANNVRCISDWGSITRCAQIGFLVSCGKWISIIPDDATFFPNEMDKVFLNIKNVDYTTFVLGKYLEGDINGVEMRNNEYFTLGYHDIFKRVTQWLPKSYYITASGPISNKLVKEIGGLDCRFETTALGCVDLSVRLQNYNSNVMIHKDPLYHLTHFPCREGDHAPVHYAMLYNDVPLFNYLYGSSECLNRKKIDINNWQNSPKVWNRRFEL